jgi:hypothetical protein
MINETFSSHFNPQPSPLEAIQPALDLIEQITNQDTLNYISSQKEQEASVEETKPSRKSSKPAQEEVFSA